MANRRGAAILALAALLPAAAGAEGPMSAIDWLSESVATPAAAPPDEEPAVSGPVTIPQVAVTVLGQPTPDAAGVLPPSVTGLPRALWGLGQTDEIIALLAVDRGDALPALKALLLTVLLAEADAPADSTGKGTLLLVRLDKLLALGALDQAEALLEAAGETGQPDLFRRAFDVALLTGTEDRACEAMRSTPNLAPTFQARIFCLARSGDWNAAALTLRTGVALGHLTQADEALLSRFLDPELYEGEPALAPPSPVTPLDWRMMEAIGETLPTGSLPLAFSHAELRDTAGWKAQVEAAERLSRANVVAPNLLLGLYTLRSPAASGGVWDRVAAFQKFESAITQDDSAALETALPAVWQGMVGAELEVPFAQLFGAALMQKSLSGSASDLALRVALLSPDYEKAALARDPGGDAVETFLLGVARGNVTGLTAPDSLARAIAAAFVAPEPGPELTALLEGNRLGEAILRAMDRVASGVRGGDLAGVTQGLSLLRRVGLEDVARRTALELLLLERRG
jgi:hypothetical protein